MTSSPAHSCVPESLLLILLLCPLLGLISDFLLNPASYSAKRQQHVKLRNSVETGNPVCECWLSTWKGQFICSHHLRENSQRSHRFNPLFSTSQGLVVSLR